MALRSRVLLPLLLVLGLTACGRKPAPIGLYAESATVVPEAGRWSRVQPGSGWVLHVSHVTPAPFGIGEATQTTVLVELPSTPPLGSRVDLTGVGVRARCEQGNIGARSFAARGSVVLLAKTAVGYSTEFDLTCLDPAGAEIWQRQGQVAVSKYTP